MLRNPFEPERQPKADNKCSHAVPESDCFLVDLPVDAENTRLFVVLDTAAGFVIGAAEKVGANLTSQLGWKAKERRWWF